MVLGCGGGVAVGMRLNGFQFNPRISGEPTRGKVTFPFCLLVALVRSANQEAAVALLIT